MHLTTFEGGKTVVHPGRR